MFTSWLVLALLSCSSTATQLVVVVDTDYAVPSELDAVRFEVTGPAGMAQTVTQSVGDEGDPDLPLTLTLVPAGDALGPVSITVTGLRGTTELVERRAVATLERGESSMLTLFLGRVCAGADCGPGRAAAEIAARSTRTRSSRGAAHRAVAIPAPRAMEESATRARATVAPTRAPVRATTTSTASTASTAPPIAATKARARTRPTTRSAPRAKAAAATPRPAANTGAARARPAPRAPARPRAAKATFACASRPAAKASRAAATPASRSAATTESPAPSIVAAPKAASTCRSTRSATTA